MTWPSIDHSILSPSGKVSRRARRAALRRASIELFGPGGLQAVQPKPESDRDNMLRRAAELRSLAARGMKPRAYLKEAERLEQEASR